MFKYVLSFLRFIKTLTQLIGCSTTSAINAQSCNHCHVISVTLEITGRGEQHLCKSVTPELMNGKAMIQVSG